MAKQAILTQKQPELQMVSYSLSGDCEVFKTHRKWSLFC